MLSAIYYAASLPLEPGRTFSFPLNDGGESVDVNLHVEAREQIKTPAGTFNTLRTQPEAAKGLVRDKGKLWIWYTTIAAHVPVQMRAPHELGNACVSIAEESIRNKVERWQTAITRTQSRKISEKVLSTRKVRHALS